MSYNATQAHGDSWQAAQPNSAVSAPVIVLVALAAGAFLIVTYYNYFVRFCKCRLIPARREEEHVVHDIEGMIEVTGSAVLLSRLALRMLPVIKYRKEDIEGSECAVCLTDFQENEQLRVLPKCKHAFHVDCVDMWLCTHASCPICRSSLFCIDDNVLSFQYPEILVHGGVEDRQQNDDPSLVAREVPSSQEDDMEMNQSNEEDGKNNTKEQNIQSVEEEVVVNIHLQ